MRRRIIHVAVGLLFIWCTSVVAQTDQINLLLSRLPTGQDPQRYKGYVEPRFKTITHRSFYLPMRDGVKIALTVVLPKDLPPDEKVPAILNMTRYWRGRQEGKPTIAVQRNSRAQSFIELPVIKR